VEFFDQKAGMHGNDAGTINLEKLCVIYLAYFDEARGHQLLLVHPPELKKNATFLQAESKILFIHSIWWMGVDVQAELNHVDLEYNGRNYLAKKFLAPSHRPKKRSGMDDTTPETIVLILNIPIILNPFGGELLSKLYMGITSKHMAEFSIAIEKTICDAKIIKSPRDKEISMAGEGILDRLAGTIQATLHEFASQLEVSVSSVDEKRKALAYMLYQDMKGKPGSSVNHELFEHASGSAIVDIGALAKSRIVLADAMVKKEENKVSITLRNTALEEMCGCIVSIAYVEEYFEKYFYNVDVDCWFAGEELNFQFERIGNKPKEEYLITVKGNGKDIIFQKKFLTSKLKVE
jgi:hypothetical protein